MHATSWHTAITPNFSAFNHGKNLKQILIGKQEGHKNSARVLAPNTLGHDPKVITAMTPQHSPAVGLEMWILMNESGLALKAVHKEEDGQQRTETCASR